MKRALWAVLGFWVARRIFGREAVPARRVPQPIDPQILRELGAL
jgi:hypothetical protein